VPPFAIPEPDIANIEFSTVGQAETLLNVYRIIFLILHTYYLSSESALKSEILCGAEVILSLIPLCPCWTNPLNGPQIGEGNVHQSLVVNIQVQHVVNKANGI